MSKQKYLVIQEHDDYNSRLKIGDVVEIDMSNLESDIINIAGAHYKLEELCLYFKEYGPLKIYKTLFRGRDE